MFYEEFEPYRLVLFNSWRKDIAQRISEDIQHLFPWYTFLVEEDEEIFFRLALVGVGSSLEPELTPALEALAHDQGLKKLVERERYTAQLLYQALARAPHLVLFNRICEADMEFAVPEEVEEKGYFQVAFRAWKRLKQKSGQEALEIFLMAGPMDDETRLSLLKRLLQNKKLDELPKVEEAFEKWLEVCQEVATSQEAISVSEEEAKILVVKEVSEEVSKIKRPWSRIKEKAKTIQESVEKKSASIIERLIESFKLRLMSNSFEYSFAFMGEEEKEIKLSSSWFEVEISGKRGKSFYPFEEEELKVLTEEEFEKLKKLSDLFYFVCPERKLPTELREAEEIEDVRIERAESEGVEKVYLFLSPEKKILEKLREALTKEEREAVEELTRSGKVVGVEIILKE